MAHHDEKGRISPAQSKVARGLSGKSTPLSHRTMAQIAEHHPYGGKKSGKHAYGEVHHGLSGMSRMAHLKEINKGKKAKSRIVLRGQKSEGHKAYTKIGRRFHVKGLLHAPKVEE